MAVPTLICNIVHKIDDKFDIIGREVIAYLRSVAPGHYYATSMGPPAAEMIISALRVISGQDGTDRGARKIAALHDNSNYFRRRLLEMGCNVLGDWDSPVMVRCTPLSAQSS